MRIDRMVLNFPDMKNTIVDSEAFLKNFSLERCVSIDVRVTMNMGEFEAFREWKAQYSPPRPVVAERPKEAKDPDEYENFSY